MNGVAGTGQLARLIMRRDRFLLPVWVLLLALLPVSYASATEGLYPTQEGLQDYYTSIVTNPSLMSTIGPVFAPNLGSLTAWRAGFLLVITAVISLLTVIRHTRTEEDAGRRELVGAGVLGRQAPLVAALAVTGTANLLVGAVMALAMTGYGLPAAGSVTLGLSFALTGLFGATVGAVTAQLTEGAGAARGLGLGLIGVAYLLRAVGDASGLAGGISWLSWLSPIGWAQRTRPYAEERWWLPLLLVALAAALLAAAVRLQARRDIGAGIVPPRLGPATAAPALRSPLALAWRLNRGALLGWCAGFAAIGLTVGGATRSIDTMAADGRLRDLLTRLGGGHSLTDAYLASSVAMFGLVAAGYAIAAVLRLASEESGLRAEPILATGVRRTSWAASHIGFALAGPALALAVLGLAAGVASGDLGNVGAVVAGALLQLPAIWVLAALAVAGFGLLPRLAAPIAWGALAVCVLLSFVGVLLGFDQYVLDASPFTHLPRVPGGPVKVVPLLWLLLVAGGLTAVGLVTFRRRDITGGA